MKIIAHPTRACGVNIATSLSVQRVVHSSCELCMRGRYGKPTQGSTQNHRMDACLRSKLLRGGVGKSQKTCGESKFHDEKGKANKESGCRRRTGPKVGRTGQRVVPVWCLCRGLIGARWRDVRWRRLRRGARRGGLRRVALRVGRDRARSGKGLRLGRHLAHLPREARGRKQRTPVAHRVGSWAADPRSGRA